MRFLGNAMVLRKRFAFSTRFSEASAKTPGESVHGCSRRLAGRLHSFGSRPRDEAAADTTTKEGVPAQMLLAIYLIPLAAWAAFVYHMHHSGGRPTTTLWWASMTGLGTFELGKGMAAAVGGVPAVASALCLGVFAAGVVLIVQAHRTWTTATSKSEGFHAIPAGGQ
jgi:hypothetical protein